MKLLRRLVDGSSLVLGKVRRNRLIVPVEGQSPVKVNIGCGLAVVPGWINIDGSLNALVATLPSSFHRLAYRFTGAHRYYSREEYCRILQDHCFVHHDLVYGIPLADNMVDYIYSSHFLEHLSRQDGVSLAEEMFRVIKPGGIVRISVPDLAYAVSLYEQGYKEKMLISYFFVEDDDSYFARHKYMYDFNMLSEMLIGAGFVNVRRCKVREGRTPDLDALDNRPEDSLFVEAERS